MTGRLLHVAKQQRGGIQNANQYVLASSVEEIGDGSAAGDSRFGQACARMKSGLDKLPIAHIMKKEWSLGVRHTERMAVHLGIHVAVGNEDVLPSVVVVIEELHAKPEEGDADGTDARRSCQVGKLAVLVIVVKVVSVIGKVGLDDVGPAIVIVVGRV